MDERPATLLGTPGPTRMATADLRYPSKDDFLAELAAFAEEVSEGEILRRSSGDVLWRGQL